jgi:BatD DUF11 like domain
MDRDRIASGETVELTLQHDGRTDSQPDVSALRQDFDILGRASGSSIQIVNGRVSAKMQLRLTLAPRHNGHIRIPSLTWDGEQSSAIDLLVGGAQSGGTGTHAPAGNQAIAGNDHIFIRSSLDQAQPYVQAGATLTVRLYTDQPIYQASLELPANNDILAQQVGQDSQTSEVHNGRRYQVVERKYLLVPQRSGRIRLEGPVLDAQAIDRNASDPFTDDPFFGRAFGNIFGRNPLAGMMNATRPLRLHGDPVVLDVRPRPSSGTGREWLPAQRVTLSESWSPDHAQVRAGEPLTRHLSLAAVGLTAAQLPDLAAMMHVPEGIRTYPDQAKLDTAVQGGKVVGHRDQDIALIASHPGHFRLPPMHLEWWDTTRNRQQVVELPARELDILPGAGGVAATTDMSATVASGLATKSEPVPQATPTGVNTGFPWPWLSLALGLLWLGTSMAWWHTRHSTSPAAKVEDGPSPKAATPPSANEPRKAFRQACRDNDATAARSHLLAWAQAAWPDDPPAGLNALARRLDQAGIADLLRGLDRACYAGGAWNGAALLEALATLPKKRTSEAGSESALPVLYP